MDKPDYAAAMDTVLRAIQARGVYDSICPESLEDIKERADKWGWYSITPTIPGPELRAAYNTTMDGFRALFAPVE